jgi:hypothetical protein
MGGSSVVSDDWGDCNGHGTHVAGTSKSLAHERLMDRIFIHSKSRLTPNAITLLQLPVESMAWPLALIFGQLECLGAVVVEPRPR